MKKSLKNIKEMKAVELFAGIGGFRSALERLGIETIWANDINPKSIEVYKHCFGSKNVVEGDIKTLENMIPNHDLLTAGFPCQPFSAAGKKEGIRDPRGTLFENIVNVLKDKSPKYFVLENVKRLLTMESSNHFSSVLSALSQLDYLIEWRVLNTKHFGLAQNRERIFITGKKLAPNSPEVISPQPCLANSEDFGNKAENLTVLLQDSSRWKSISRFKDNFSSWGLAYKGKFITFNPEEFTDGQKPVLLKNILQKKPPKEYDLTSTTLDRVASSKPVNKLIGGVEVLLNQGGGIRMGYTIYGTNGLSPTLTASTSRHYERYFINGIYRRLTPIEYARLQGFSDDHCSVSRPYDQYSLLGNAVAPPVAEWVVKRLLNTPEFLLSKQVLQGDLFVPA